MKEILRAFYAALEVEIIDLKDRGVILFEEKEYYKTKVKFTEWTITSKGSSTSIEEITVKEINWLTFYKFVREDVKKIPEYKECLLYILRKSPEHEKLAEWYLESFIRGITPHIIKGATENQKEKDIEIFIRDLDEKPQNWTVKVYLYGILIDEKIKFSGTTIRKPLPKDYEKVIPKEDVSFLTSYNHIDMCDSILDFHTTALTTADTQNQL